MVKKPNGVVIAFSIIVSILIATSAISVILFFFTNVFGNNESDSDSGSEEESGSDSDNGSEEESGSGSESDEESGNTDKFTDKNIKFDFSGKCLAVPSSSKVDGAGLIQWDCGEGEDQLFSFDEKYRLKPKHSGMCLSASDAGKLSQTACNDKTRQKWTLDGNRWKNKNTSKCLYMGNGNNGTNVSLKKCDDTDNQKISHLTKGDSEEKEYHQIKLSSTPSHCIHTQNGRGNGTDIHLWGCANAPNKNDAWFYDKKTKQIKLKDEEKKCLSAVGGDVIKDGNNIHLWDCTDSSQHGYKNQQWDYDEETKQFKLTSKPAKCIATTAGRKNASKIHLWQCRSSSDSGYKNQGWDFKKI